MPTNADLFDQGIAAAAALANDSEIPFGRGAMATPTQARNGVATVDRIASALHKDVVAARPRQVFMRAWEECYNRWLSFKILDADRLCASDPGGVVATRLPAFAEGMLKWRNALAREVGTEGVGSRVGAGAVAAVQTAAKRRLTVWHMLGIATGVIVLYKGYRWLTAPLPGSTDRPALPNPTAVAPQGMTQQAIIPPIVVYPPPAPPPAPVYAALPPPPHAFPPYAPSGQYIARGGGPDDPDDPDDPGGDDYVEDRDDVIDVEG